MKNLLFEISNLEKSFTNENNEKETILKVPKLELERGKIIALIGESGSGKTTLMNILSLLDDSDKGSKINIRLTNNKNDVEDLAKLSDKLISKIAINFRKENFGFVFQNDLLSNNLDMNANAKHAINIKYQKTDLNSYNNYLEFLGLNKILYGNQKSKNKKNKKNKINIRNLSGGQRTRLSVLRALLGNPKVLFADEPTADLDQRSSIDVMNLLCTWVSDDKRNNNTLFFSTHSIELALTYADRIIIFNPDNKEYKTIYDPIDISGELDDVMLKNIQKKYNVKGIDLTGYKKGIVNKIDIIDKIVNKKLNNIEKLYINLKQGYRSFFSFGGFFSQLPGFSFMLTYLLIAIFTIGSLGFQKGNKAIYEKELNNPFLRSIVIEDKNEQFDNINKNLYLTKTDMKRSYIEISLRYLSNIYPTESRSLNVHTIQSNDTLLHFLMNDKDGVIWKNEYRNIFEGNAAYGCIISKYTLNKLGIEGNDFDDFINKPAYTKVLNYQNGGKLYPLPILAIVSELPGTDIYVSNNFMAGRKKNRLMTKDIRIFNKFSETSDKLIISNDTDLSSFKKSLIASAKDLKNLINNKSNKSETLQIDTIFDISLVQNNKKIFIKTKNNKKMATRDYRYIIEKAMAKMYPKINFSLFVPKYPSNKKAEQFKKKQNKSPEYLRIFVHSEKEKMIDFINTCVDNDISINQKILRIIEYIDKNYNHFNLINTTITTVILFILMLFHSILILSDTYRDTKNMGISLAMGKRRSSLIFLSVLFHVSIFILIYTPTYLLSSYFLDGYISNDGYLMFLLGDFFTTQILYISLIIIAILIFIKYALIFKKDPIRLLNE